MPAGTTINTISVLSVSYSSLEILGTVNDIVVRMEDPIRIYGEGLKNTTISNGLDSGEVKVILAESGNEQTTIEKDKPLKIDDKGNAVVETYTVKFNSKDGSTVDAITGIKEGATVTLPEAPTKEGFTFIGWFTTEEFTTEFTASTPITENITVYAKWEAVVDETKADVESNQDLIEALNNIKVKTINIMTNITVENTVKPNPGVTINGNGNTLKFDNGIVTGDSTAEGLYIANDDIVIENIIIDTVTHGDNLIEIYNSTKLDTVTVKNGKKTGIYVNHTGSGEIVVDFKNITTSNNGWNAGIGLAAKAEGSKVVANFSGNNSFGEDVAVYHEGTTYSGTYEVNGISNEYTEVTVGNQQKWMKEIPTVEDTTDPVINLAEAARNVAGDIVLTVTANDKNLYSLEVDHSHGSHGKWASANLPEFTIYASKDNPWGDDDASEAAAMQAGVEASYDAETQTWTLTLKNDGVVMSIIDGEISNGAFEFYLVANDEAGNSSGDMNGNYKEVVVEALN